MTIGDVRTWPVGKAQAEATRLKALTDQGVDPRQQKAEKLAVEQSAREAKEAEAAALVQKEAIESVTAGEAWKAYIADRGAAIKDGKPEWGEQHRAHLEYFMQAGGVKRKRGRRPNEPETTHPGILVPLMSKRLADLDAKTIAAWLEKEAAQAPTSTAKAFSVLRAFLTWCAKQDEYCAIVHTDACKTDAVKRIVPAPKTKKNDSLRKAQIRPWFEAVQKVGNPVIAAYLQPLLLTGARRKAQ